jgi:hypothetical protein
MVVRSHQLGWSGLMSYDWHAIAGRIRGLIRVPPDGDLAAVATRLGVSERSLRMSVDGGVPLPTLDVVAAVVRVYGLDPSWVLTGQYNAATHRVALESSTQEIEIAMTEMISSAPVAPAGTDKGPARRT